MSTRETRTRNRRYLAPLAILLILAMFAGACGGDDGDAFDQSAADGESDDGEATDADQNSDEEPDGENDGDPESDNPDSDSPDSEDPESNNQDAENSDSGGPDSDDPDSDASGDSPDQSSNDDEDEDEGVEIAASRDGFCGDFHNYLQKTVDLMNVIFDDDAAAIKAAAGPLLEAIEMIEESVPDDLFDEMQTANESFVGMIGTLEKYDYDLEAAWADPAAQVEETPEMEAAEQAVYDYAVAECDYDPEAFGLEPPD